MSSIVITRSSSGKALTIERSSVLFPEPVAPAIRMLARATAIASRNAPIWTDSPPTLTQLAAPGSRSVGKRPSRTRLNFRMHNVGPPTGA